MIASQSRAVRFMTYNMFHACFLFLLVCIPALVSAQLLPVSTPFAARLASFQLACGASLSGTMSTTNRVMNAYLPSTSVFVVTSSTVNVCNISTKLTTAASAAGELNFALVTDGVQANNVLNSPAALGSLTFTSLTGVTAPLTVFTYSLPQLLMLRFTPADPEASSEYQPFVFTPPANIIALQATAATTGTNTSVTAVVTYSTDSTGVFRVAADSSVAALSLKLSYGFLLPNATITLQQMNGNTPVAGTIIQFQPGSLNSFSSLSLTPLPVVLNTETVYRLSIRFPTAIASILQGMDYSVRIASTSTPFNTNLQTFALRAVPRSTAGQTIPDYISANFINFDFSTLASGQVVDVTLDGGALQAYADDPTAPPSDFLLTFTASWLPGGGRLFYSTQRNVLNDVAGTDPTSGRYFDLLGKKEYQPFQSVTNMWVISDPNTPAASDVITIPLFPAAQDYINLNAMPPEVIVQFQYVPLISGGSGAANAGATNFTCRFHIAPLTSIEFHGSGADGISMLIPLFQTNASVYQRDAFRFNALVPEYDLICDPYVTTFNVHATTPFLNGLNILAKPLTFVLDGKLITSTTNATTMPTLRFDPTGRNQLVTIAFNITFTPPSTSYRNFSSFALAPTNPTTTYQVLYRINVIRRQVPITNTLQDVTFYDETGKILDFGPFDVRSGGVRAYLPKEGQTTYVLSVTIPPNPSDPSGNPSITLKISYPTDETNTVFTTIDVPKFGLSYGDLIFPLRCSSPPNPDEVQTVILDYTNSNPIYPDTVTSKSYSYTFLPPKRSFRSIISQVALVPPISYVSLNNLTNVKPHLMQTQFGADMDVWVLDCSNLGIETFSAADDFNSVLNAWIPLQILQNPNQAPINVAIDLSQNIISTLVRGLFDLSYPSVDGVSMVRFNLLAVNMSLNFPFVDSFDAFGSNIISWLDVSYTQVPPLPKQFAQYWWRNTTLSASGLLIPSPPPSFIKTYTNTPQLPHPQAFDLTGLSSDMTWNRIDLSGFDFGSWGSGSSQLFIGETMKLSQCRGSGGSCSSIPCGFICNTCSLTKVPASIPYPSTATNAGACSYDFSNNPLTSVNNLPMVKLNASVTNRPTVYGDLLLVNTNSDGSWPNNWNLTGLTFGVIDLSYTYVGATLGTPFAGVKAIKLSLASTSIGEFAPNGASFKNTQLSILDLRYNSLGLSKNLNTALLSITTNGISTGFIVDTLLLPANLPGLTAAMLPTGLSNLIIQQLTPFDVAFNTAGSFNLGGLKLYGRSTVNTACIKAGLCSIEATITSGGVTTTCMSPCLLSFTGITIPSDTFSSSALNLPIGVYNLDVSDVRVRVLTAPNSIFAVPLNSLFLVRNRLKMEGWNHVLNPISFAAGSIPYLSMSRSLFPIQSTSSYCPGGCRVIPANMFNAGLSVRFLDLRNSNLTSITDTSFSGLSFLSLPTTIDPRAPLQSLMLDENPLSGGISANALAGFSQTEIRNGVRIPSLQLLSLRSCTLNTASFPRDALGSGLHVARLDMANTRTTAGLSLQNIFDPLPSVFNVTGLSPYMNYFSFGAVRSLPPGMFTSGYSMDGKTLALHFEDSRSGVDLHPSVELIKAFSGFSSSTPLPISPTRTISNQFTLSVSGYGYSTNDIPADQFAPYLSTSIFGPDEIRLPFEPEFLLRSELWRAFRNVSSIVFTAPSLTNGDFTTDDQAFLSVAELGPKYSDANLNLAQTIPWSTLYAQSSPADNSEFTYVDPHVFSPLQKLSSFRIAFPAPPPFSLTATGTSVLPSNFFQPSLKTSTPGMGFSTLGSIDLTYAQIGLFPSQLFSREYTGVATERQLGLPNLLRLALDYNTLLTTPSLISDGLFDELPDSLANAPALFIANLSMEALSSFSVPAQCDSPSVARNFQGIGYCSASDLLLLSLVPSANTIFDASVSPGFYRYNPNYQLLAYNSTVSITVTVAAGVSVDAQSDNQTFSVMPVPTTGPDTSILTFLIQTNLTSLAPFEFLIGLSYFTDQSSYDLIVVPACSGNTTLRLFNGQKQCSTSSTCSGGYYLQNNACLLCTAGYSCDGSGSPQPCAGGSWSAAGAASCTMCDSSAWSPAMSNSSAACTPIASSPDTAVVSMSFALAFDSLPSTFNGSLVQDFSKLFSVSASRFRVLGVYAGSVVVSMAVLPSSTDSTSVSDVLKNIFSLPASGWSNGDITRSMTAITSTHSPPSYTGPTSSAANGGGLTPGGDNGTSGTSSSSNSTTMLIIIIAVVGGVILIAGAIILYLCVFRTKSNIPDNKHAAPHPPRETNWQSQPTVAAAASSSVAYSPVASHPVGGSAVRGESAVVSIDEVELSPIGGSGNEGTSSSPKPTIAAEPVNMILPVSPASSSSAVANPSSTSTPNSIGGPRVRKEFIFTKKATRTPGARTATIAAAPSSPSHAQIEGVPSPSNTQAGNENPVKIHV